jgi:hypothetical protein
MKSTFWLVLPLMRSFMAQFALISILLVFTNCASMKQKNWLAEYQTELTRVANDETMKPEAKMDVIMNTYASVMERGLKFLDPRDITKQSSDWISGMKTTEGVTFGLRVTQKSYLPRYIDLVPKMYRKYEQYKAVHSLTKSILGGFGNYGDTILGMVLK